MHYAPLVTQVATRMIGRLPDSVELADLVSYGMFGLIDAIEKFEVGRGFKFETYAATRVRGSIIDELACRGLGAAVGPFQGPRGRDRDPQPRAAPAAPSDGRRRGRRAWLGDHRSPHGASAGRAQPHRRRSTPSALATTPRTIEIVAALAVPGAASSVEVREAHALLATAVQGVRDREQQVLHLYYYENLTLNQIGQILGVTESRVSQIHSAAVKKLRESLEQTGAFA